MKIMSFNTQHCLNYLEQKIDYEIMADAIRKCDADIVGLNEMRNEGADPEYENQVKILSELTGMKYYYFAEAIKFLGFKPYGNGFLSKIPIETVETIIIPDPEVQKYDGYYETRSLLKAKLENGLTVLVTHFGLNPDEHENAVKTILDNIKDEKCILMGDFNVRPENDILAPIRERMTDAADFFGKELFSFPSDNPNRKIDYIFVSKDLKVNSADIPAIVAADHRPHTAEIEFQEN